MLIKVRHYNFKSKICYLIIIRLILCCSEALFKKFSYKCALVTLNFQLLCFLFSCKDINNLRKFPLATSIQHKKLLSFLRIRCSQKPKPFSSISCSSGNRHLVLCRHLRNRRTSCSGKGRAARQNSQAAVLALVQWLAAPFCSAGKGFPARARLKEIWTIRSKNKSTFAVECPHSSLWWNSTSLVCIIPMLEACSLVALHSIKGRSWRARQKPHSPLNFWPVQQNAGPPSCPLFLCDGTLWVYLTWSRRHLERK